MSGSGQLMQMANDIGNFFRAEPKREDAIEGIASHINKFWTRRMREKLVEQASHQGAELDELLQEAVRRVNTGPTPTVRGPEPTTEA
jgi:formate dehydrogenase subunit delta